MMQHSRSSALPRICLKSADCQQNTVIGHTIAQLCKSQSRGFWNVWTVEGDVLGCVVLTSCCLKPFPLSSELQMLSHTHTLSRNVSAFATPTQAVCTGTVHYPCVSPLNWLFELVNKKHLGCFQFRLRLFCIVPEYNPTLSPTSKISH